MNITLVKALIVLIPAAVLAARSALIIRRHAVAAFYNYLAQRVS